MQSTLGSSSRVSSDDQATERAKKIQIAPVSKLGGIEYQMFHIPRGPRDERSQGNSYLQFFQGDHLGRGPWGELQEASRTQELRG